MSHLHHFFHLQALNGCQTIKIRYYKVRLPITSKSIFVCPTHSVVRVKYPNFSSEMPIISEFSKLTLKVFQSKLTCPHSDNFVCRKKLDLNLPEPEKLFPKKKTLSNRPFEISQFPEMVKKWPWQYM